MTIFHKHCYDNMKYQFKSNSQEKLYIIVVYQIPSIWIISNYCSNQELSNYHPQNGTFDAAPCVKMPLRSIALLLFLFTNNAYNSTGFIKCWNCLQRKCEVNYITVLYVMILERKHLASELIIRVLYGNYNNTCTTSMSLTKLPTFPGI